MNRQTNRPHQLEGELDIYRLRAKVKLLAAYASQAAFSKGRGLEAVALQSKAEVRKVYESCFSFLRFSS